MGDHSIVSNQTNLSNVWHIPQDTHSIPEFNFCMSRGVGLDVGWGG